MTKIILVLAIGFALAFFVLREAPYFRGRALMKAALSLLLAAYCYYAGGAMLWAMSAGFILSALGDFFLDLPEDHFMAGLSAFFLAHVAFLVYLVPAMPEIGQFSAVDYGLMATTLAFTFGFYFWLKSSLETDLIIPVAAYALVIALMGIAAFTTTLSSVLVPLGALLFILSDVVLAVERFKSSFSGAKRLNWILYASGQTCLAIGVVARLGTV